MGVGRGPRRHFLLASMCCCRSGFVCGAPGRRRPRGPRRPRAAAELVLSWPSPRRGSGRRGAGPVPQPRGGVGWCSGSGKRWAVRGTPSRRRLVGPGPGVAPPAPAPQLLPGPARGGGLAPCAAAHVSAGRAGGRGSPAPGAERAMCHGRDGGAGGRGEPVAWRRRGLGVEGRGCAAAAAFWGLRPRLGVAVGSR